MIKFNNLNKTRVNLSKTELGDRLRSCSNQPLTSGSQQTDTVGVTTDLREDNFKKLSKFGFTREDN